MDPFRCYDFAIGTNRLFLMVIIKIISSKVVDRNDLQNQDLTEYECYVQAKLFSIC